MRATRVLLAGLVGALLCQLAGAAALADLIRTGERKDALAMIRQGGDMNAPTDDGSTPLLLATYRSDHELVDMLLQRGADPDRRNLFGATALTQAVEFGDERMVALLIGAGADPDLGNDDNQTPLMLAARGRSLPIAQLLVKAGAKVDVHENFRGQTALMWAIGAGSAEVTDFLIGLKANIEHRADAHDWGNQMTSEPRTQYRPTGGLTPLLYATRSGCLACARSLVAAGADINRPTLEGVTPLMNAIDNGNYDIANFLLDQGADPHRADWWARTALYIAVDMRTRGGGSGGGGGRGGGPGPAGPAGVRLTDAPAPPPQGTALQVLERLLEMGVEVNPQLNTHRPLRGRFTDDLLTTGCTPLLRAAVAHDMESIELLLKYGAQPDLPNVMGVTPLMAAAGIGRGTGSSDTGVIPRGPDAERSAIAVISRLVEAGADINARITDTSSRTAVIARPSSMTNRQGQTAIFGTIGRSWTRAAQFLIDRGARLDVKDDAGKTLLDAVERKAGGRDPEISPEMVQLIKTAMGGKLAAMPELPRHIVLNELQHVSGQPSVEAIGQLRAAGFQTVIDLRPDQETPGLDKKAAVEGGGLKYRALPVNGAADLTRENVVRFDQLLKESESEKVLMHCASGNRVGAMMALRARWLEGKSADDALAIGRAAGMTGLATDVQRLLEADVPRATPLSRQ